LKNGNGTAMKSMNFSFNSGALLFVLLVSGSDFADGKISYNYKQHGEDCGLTGGDGKFLISEILNSSQVGLYYSD